MLFTCAHVYTRTTHAHARALYLDIQAKPKTFLRAHTRVLQGIYIRGRTYAHARAQISKNIYCIHYYDYYDSFHNMHILSYTYNICIYVIFRRKCAQFGYICKATFCYNKSLYLFASL